MNASPSSARIAALPNHDKTEILKALAAGLGYILHPKSRTIHVFGREYIVAQVSIAQPFSSTQLLLFPDTAGEPQTD